MNFLRKLLSEKPVRTPIGFGINENVRLVSISNEPRFKDDARLERNTFLTFKQYDPKKGTVVASTETFYFDLRPGEDYTAKSLAKQYGQLQCICNALNADTTIDPTLIYKDEDEYYAGLADKSKCEEMQDLMYKQFSEGVKDLIGEDSQLLRMKVVTSRDGKHLNLPNTSLFLESMEQEVSSLSITPYELKCKRAANLPQTMTPDGKGGVPGEKAKAKDALALL